MTTYLNYLPKIHIHPILLVFVFIAFLTGTFMEMFIIISIVLIHELGHFIAARYFKWRINSIMLWVFGGVMNTDEHGSKPLYQEAIVIMAGPLQNLLIYIVLYFFSIYHLLPVSVLESIFYYNSAILLFNLLPIWPLDGGKLVLIILSSLLPYRKAYDYTIVFSMILISLLLISQLIFFKFTLSAFFIMLFLLFENRTEWKQRFFVFIRFLLQRYDGDTTVTAVHPLVVSHEDLLMQIFVQFKRDKKHPIYISYPDQTRKFIDESDCLRSYFHEKSYNKTVGEIAQKMI